MALTLDRHRPIALLVVTAQLGAKKEHIGLVTGLVISARSLGGAIGVASKPSPARPRAALLTPPSLSRDGRLRAEAGC